MPVMPLSRSSEAELQQAGKCWAAGIFPTNPLSRRMVGHSMEISQKRGAAITAREEAYVAYVKDADQAQPENIKGVLVISRPKGHRIEQQTDSSAVNATPSNKSIGLVIPPADQEWINTTMRDWWKQFSERFFGPNGNDNRLYVVVLSVLPECQNQGLGREMMDVVVQIADEHGWESSLATSGDDEHIEPLLRFYARYGYEVVGHDDLDSGTEGVCRTWALIRPARKPNA